MLKIKNKFFWYEMSWVNCLINYNNRVFVKLNDLRSVVLVSKICVSLQE